MSLATPLKVRLCGLLSGLLALLALLALPALAEEPDLGPTLNKIRERGYIYVAHRPSTSPFSYLLSGEGDKSTVTGYSWELCEHVVKAIEAKVGKSLIVVPVPATANNRLMLVKAGMADMECGATTNMVSRQKMVGFSNSFFVAEVKLMVRVDGPVKVFTDLANKRVAAVLGGTAVRLVRQAALAKGITLKIIETRNAGDAMAMLASGEIEGYSGDDAIVNDQRANAKNPDAYVFLPDSLSIEPYGIVLPREDDAYRALVNQTLVSLMASGEVERLYDKWFMAPIPPRGIALNMPMTPLIKAIIQNPNDFPASN
jgi:glutamate/aspartate transport system substrate-binding protein